MENHFTYRTYCVRVELANTVSETRGDKILPKCPEKRASRQEVISGIHLYRAKIAGIRLKIIIPTVRIANRHGVTPRSSILKESNGIHAPMYTKQAQLRTRSMTEENTSPSVWVLKSPSHEMALPVGEEESGFYFQRVWKR